MKEKIILIGGGGHCKACIDVIEAEGKFDIAGIIDLKENIGKEVLGYEIIGSDEYLPDLAKEHKNFLITIGQIKSPNKKIEIFDKLKELDVKLPDIISPSAYLSNHSEIGEGTIVLHRACINADVKIGRNCIINTFSIIEHDTVVADHSHISTGAVINGGCNIGRGVFVGSNSTVINNLRIAKGAVIGAGSIIVRTIDNEGTYIGKYE